MRALAIVALLFWTEASLPAGGPPDGGTPQRLWGRWSTPPTPRGSTFSWDFDPAGTFVRENRVDSLINGCTTSVRQRDEGTYAAEGSVLIVQVTRATTWAESACPDGLHYQRERKSSTTTYLVRIQPNARGVPMLILATPKSEERFVRAPDEQAGPAGEITPTPTAARPASGPR